MSTAYKKLEEVCEILDSRRVPITEKNRKAGIYPYYGANGLQDYVAEYIFDDELVLLAEDGGNFGSKERPIAYRVSGKCWVNNHAHVLKAKPLVNVDYLCYALMFYDTEGLVNGATRQKLTQAAMRQMVIPYRDMTEQLQIVEEISQVIRLIDKRKEELSLLDQLVKSRFIELFGNFIYDRDKWQICEVGDVADTVDPQPSHRTPPVSSDGVPYIGIAECNYRTRLIDFEKARKVGQNVLQEHMERYTLDEGDFIIGKIGTIGKPFFVPAEQTYTLSANTVLIKPVKKKVNPQYLFAVFQSEYMDRIIDAEKKSTSQPAFGIQKVRRIEIPIPPMELQEQFTAFVKQTDKSKYYSAIMYRKSGEPYCQSEKKLICICEMFSRCNIWFPIAYRTG